MWPEGTRHSEVVTNAGVIHACPLAEGWSISLGRETILVTDAQLVGIVAFLESLRAPK